MVSTHTSRWIWVGVFVLALASCLDNHGTEGTLFSGTACIDCHLDEYTSAADPLHPGVLPAESCGDCHTNDAWLPSIFAHQIRIACVTCHQTNYDSTADPVHLGRFPTTCDDCHGTVAWRPALEGIHPEADFRIGGGPHEGIGCVDCHDPNRGPSLDGANTDCVGCHTGEHSQSEMADKHNEVANYVFDANMPNFCLGCHPNGRN